MKVEKRDEKKEQFDVWYGDDRFRSKSLVEYVRFLKNLQIEVIFQLAYVCRDIRRLEGRE